MKLTHKIVPVDHLNAAVVGRMFTLMEIYYGNMQRDTFVRDLARKDGVLLVFDDDRQVCGFTTYALFETEYRARPLSILYSGDTVIEERYWGSLATTRLFTALLADCLRRAPHDLYWFLLSKGVRTYQLLPLYFRTFYPRGGELTPCHEAELISYLAELQFGERYRPDSGVVRFGAGGDYLREDYDRRLKTGEQHHADYFFRINPGYRHGDNLPCIARIGPDNFQPIVSRWLQTINRYEFSQIHSE